MNPPSKNRIALTSMKPGNRLFWAGITLAGLGLVAAVFFYGSSNSEVPTIQPGSGKRFTAPEENIAMQAETRESASAQHLIDSGQFDPPPGSTDRLNSIANPFLRSPRAEAQGSSQKADVARPDQQTHAWVGGIISAGASDKITRAQDNESVSNPASTLAQPPTQIQSQPLEFETPPGIGSAKGGR